MTGDQTPKDLFTRWETSEITEEEAIGYSIQGLCDLEDRLDDRDRKVENLIEQQRKEIYALKKQVEQQETILKAQAEVSRTQNTMLNGQRKAIRALRGAYEADFKRLDKLIRRLTKPVETLEILLIQLGKVTKAVQRIGRTARQFLDMKQDDSAS